MDSITRGALNNGRNSVFNPITLFSSTPKPSPNLHFPIPKSPISRVSVSSTSTPKPHENPLLQSIKTTSKTLILSAATALLIAKFPQLPARADTSPPPPTEEKLQEEVGNEGEREKSPLSQFLETRSEAVEALKTLLDQKIDAGEDSEAVQILKRLVSAQPLNLDWKFLMARLLNEMGEVEESRKVFEEILAVNPLSFEALFENAILMDRCGEGEAVLSRLEEALRLAEGEEKGKEARDVKFIMAQVQFLQKNVDEALASYRRLAEEDPKDFRPYFCQGVIYSLLERNQEAREQFAKYHELSPRKFDVEGYLQTPMTRLKIFGTDSEN
eukprot:TRINITY_DN59096_c0_g1_i1.p1 TRINITY_DN59096_c0_g1~~TRINITY_DN59096_c0_g1_i1.p1  ORF type:complete len:328 (-),score=59.84 TRINITY_DN59096_c0_g1_i1:361-1344(-)